LSKSLIGKDYFTPKELSFIFQNQLNVALNMTPARIIKDFAEEKLEFDLLAPVEYLGGKSMCYFLLADPNEIARRLANKESYRQKNQKSLLNEFISESGMIDHYAGNLNRSHKGLTN